MRDHAETRHKAGSWNRERRAVARIEGTRLGLDIRFVVTNVERGTPAWVYDSLYCARGQAENLIKLHKGQLRSDRTSCRSVGGLIHYPDREVQYVCTKYTERFAEVGMEPSVGSRGDSHDNALPETINGLLKAEVIHRRGPWRSFEAVDYATLQGVDWYNHRRRLEPIGNVPPAEAEAAFYAALEATPMAA